MKVVYKALAALALTALSRPQDCQRALDCGFQSCLSKPLDPLALLAAVAQLAASGALIGFPIIDFKVTLLDGAYHDVDSSALAFEICARGAMREAAQKSGITLLEPVMKVEVVTPEDYLGDVIGDMNSRRGQIQGTDARGNAQTVDAMVPLANMFGYVNSLRSFTQGRASYSMQFSHYDEVPQNVADEVKAKLA